MSTTNKCKKEVS